MDDHSFMPNVQIDAERLLGSLFRHMAEGVALHEVVCDAAGKPAKLPHPGRQPAV